MSIPLDVAELFNVLESNRTQDVNEIKIRLGEMFNNMKDCWLVYGFIDYYQSTGSMRAVDILIKVPNPHDKYLLDKLGDGIRGNTWRCNALELLGHVVRGQPLWLHKITKHTIFRELLNLLKQEREIVALMSGLLVLITLLPMIPALISPFFQEIFDVFGRLAAWESHRGAEQAGGYTEHLQLGLYGLFHNLYGMFPCNFVDYLRREYSKRENCHIFAHTVRPMLATVKVHPSLITASKNAETDNSRWNKMEHHDVLIECRRFSAEGAAQRAADADDTHFRARCGTDVSSLPGAAAHLQAAKSSNSTPNLTESPTSTAAAAPPAEPPAGAVISVTYESLDPAAWFSLSDRCGAGAPSAPPTPLPYGGPRGGAPPDGGSPPEAAIEATPENTPIKDARQCFNFPSSSPAVRNLGARLSQPHFQPHLASVSQPPSPLGRVLSAEAAPPPNKLGQVLQERSQTTDGVSRRQDSVSPRKKISLMDCASLAVSVPNSPVPLGTAAPASGSTDWPLAKPRPRRNDVFDISFAKTNLLANPVENMRDDKEIIELSKRGEVMRSGSIVDVPRSRRDAEEAGLEGWGGEDEEEEDCAGEVSCSEGRHGLHMPPGSFVDFATRAKRLRYHSQCLVETTLTFASKVNEDGKSVSCIIDCLRRAKSCPNMGSVKIREIYKKGDKRKNKYDRNLSEIQAAVAFENGNVASLDRKNNTKCKETQTVDVWPISYEFLYNDILQNFCDQNQKPAVVDAPSEDKCKFSPYHEVDKYIQIVSQSATSDPNNRRSLKEEVDHLRQQLKLLQLELMYERHRREVHAVRNRRLLGRSRKNREAEEQNHVLKQQISYMQTEIEDLRQQVSRQNKNIQATDLKNIENNKYWQHQIYMRECEIVSERQEKEKLAAQLLEQQNLSNETSTDVQHLHSCLFEVSQQLNRANEKSDMSDRLIECIKRMQRELVIYAEKDRQFSCLGMLPTKTDALINKLNQQYKEQLISAQAALQAQAAKMDYYQARETALESIVSDREQSSQELKRQLRLVKEEYSERLKSVEDKYLSVKRINQRLEAHCLELLQRIPQSPQTISRDLTSGFSPQSSPLSASLASSEGHGPLLASRVDEIRNLQVIVNAHETKEESTSNSVNNSTLDDDNQ